jgi:hypothetical protein
MGLQVRDSLALHGGRYHFLGVAPASPPCRAFARPVAS